MTQALAIKTVKGNQSQKKSANIGASGEAIALNADKQIYADIGGKVVNIGRKNQTKGGQSFNTGDVMAMSNGHNILSSVKAEATNGGERKHLQSFKSFTATLATLAKQMLPGGKFYPVLKRFNMQADATIINMDEDILNIYHPTLCNTDCTNISELEWEWKTLTEKQEYREQIDAAWLSYFSSKEVKGRTQLSKLGSILFKNNYFLSLGFYFWDRRESVVVENQEHALNGYVDYIRHIHLDGSEYFFDVYDYVKDDDFYHALSKDIGCNQVERHQYGTKPILCLPFFHVRHDKENNIQIGHNLSNMYHHAKKKLVNKTDTSKTFAEYIANKKKVNTTTAKHNGVSLLFKSAGGKVMDSRGAYYIKSQTQGWKRIPLNVYGEYDPQAPQFSMMAVIHNNLLKKTKAWLDTVQGQNFIQSVQ